LLRYINLYIEKFRIKNKLEIKNCYIHQNKKFSGGFDGKILYTDLGEIKMKNIKGNCMYCAYMLYDDGFKYLCQSYLFYGNNKNKIFSKKF